MKKLILLIMVCLVVVNGYACDGCSEQAKKYGVPLKELLGFSGGYMENDPDGSKFKAHQGRILYNAITKIHEKLDNIEIRLKKLEERKGNKSVCVFCNERDGLHRNDCSFNPINIKYK
jgi:hypothetical protein